MWKYKAEDKRQKQRQTTASQLNIIFVAIFPKLQPEGSEARMRRLHIHVVVGPRTQTTQETAPVVCSYVHVLAYAAAGRRTVRMHDLWLWRGNNNSNKNNININSGSQKFHAFSSTIIFAKNTKQLQHVQWLLRNCMAGGCRTWLPWLLQQADT